MIKLTDYDVIFVSANILNIIKDVIEKSDKRVDFTGTQIISGSYKGIAEFILETGMIPLNIDDKDAIEKIETEKLKLKQKNFDTIEEFLVDLKNEFPVGKVAVLDLTMQKRRLASDMARYIVMVEGYSKNKIHLRKYRPSKMRPDIFHAVKDAKNNKEFYETTEYSIVDLYNKTVFIRKPNPPQETTVIHQLFGKLY